MPASAKAVAIFGARNGSGELSVDSDGAGAKIYMDIIHLGLRSELCTLRARVLVWRCFPGWDCWGVVELVRRLTLDQEAAGSNPASPASLHALYVLPFPPTFGFSPLRRSFGLVRC